VLRKHKIVCSAIKSFKALKMSPKIGFIKESHQIGGTPVRDNLKNVGVILSATYDTVECTETPECSGIKTRRRRRRGPPTYKCSECSGRWISVNVTTKVRRQLQNGTIDIPAVPRKWTLNKFCGGDPAPTHPKKLTVRYKLTRQNLAYKTDLAKASHLPFLRSMWESQPLIFLEQAQKEKTEAALELRLAEKNVRDAQRKRDDVKLRLAEKNVRDAQRKHDDVNSTYAPKILRQIHVEASKKYSKRGLPSDSSSDSLIDSSTPSDSSDELSLLLRRLQRKR